MTEFDMEFINNSRQKLEIDLLGVARIDESAPKILRDSAEALLPGAVSAIVFGKEIFKEVVALLRPSLEVGAAEPGALIKPHSSYLNGRLSKAVYDTASVLKNRGHRALPLPPADCPTDQRTLIAVFSYKLAAVAAGLGTIGRHGLLITPQFGPRVRLACLLTDAPVEAAAVRAENRCDDCYACIRACPAGALKKPGGEDVCVMDKFACLAYRKTGLTCSMCMQACDKALGSKANGPGPLTRHLT